MRNLKKNEKIKEPAEVLINVIKILNQVQS